MNTITKARLLQNRRWRIRKKVVGTAARPRLAVRFTTKHIYAQAINDDAGTTLVFLSSLDAELRKQKLKANLAGAKALGTAFAARAKAAGIESAVVRPERRSVPWQSEDLRRRRARRGPSILSTA
jgi:large subunit ribosomal protein L18